MAGIPTYAPNTLAVLDAIVAYLTALTYPDTSKVYSLAQAERIFDVVGKVSDGGVVCEVYGAKDDSARHALGGFMWDEQEWIVLSLCSLETQTLARQIYGARDAMVVPLQTHANLGGGIYNLFHAQVKPNTGAFGETERNGQKVKMHIITLMTRQEWQVVPPGVIS